MQHTLHDLGSPDFEALRVRAFNLRWATVDEGVIPLTAADPDLPVAPAIIEAIASYIRVPHFSYGPSTGLPTFRNAVARHFSQTKHADVDSARVIATNSAASGITLVAKHVLRAGDEVIVQDPFDSGAQKQDVSRSTDCAQRSPRRRAHSFSVTHTIHSAHSGRPTKCARSQHSRVNEASKSSRTKSGQMSCLTAAPCVHSQHTPTKHARHG